MPERKVKTADDKCWVTISQNVNLGNYEAIKIEMGFSKTYGKNEPVKVIDAMYEKLEKSLLSKVKKTKKRKK